MEGPEGKRRGRVWLSFHERFVRRAEYADRETGEEHRPNQRERHVRESGDTELVERAGR